MTDSEYAVVVCSTCGTPARVKFEDGEIVAVFSVCGHMERPQDNDPEPDPDA